MQLESSVNPMQIYAGTSYHHLEAGYLIERGRALLVASLKDALSEMGYGSYISGDSYTNIYNTVDSVHANDPSLGYLALNDGQLVITPKLYSGDDMEIVNNTEVLGLCTGHEVRLDVRNDLQNPSNLSDLGVEIVNSALDGKIVFQS